MGTEINSSHSNQASTTPIRSILPNTFFSTLHGTDHAISSADFQSWTQEFFMVDL